MATGKHYRSNKTPARQTRHSLEDSIYNYRPTAQPTEKPIPAAPAQGNSFSAPRRETPAAPQGVTRTPAAPAPTAAPRTPAPAPYTPAAAPAPRTPAQASRTPAQAPRTGKTAAPARKQKKNVWIPIVAVLLLLAAAGIVGYILWDLGVVGMLLKLLR